MISALSYIPSSKTTLKFQYKWVLCVLNHCPSLCSARSWVCRVTHASGTILMCVMTVYAGGMGWGSLALALLLPSQPDHALAFWYLIPQNLFGVKPEAAWVQVSLRKYLSICTVVIICGDSWINRRGQLLTGHFLGFWVLLCFFFFFFLLILPLLLHFASM